MNRREFLGSGAAFAFAPQVPRPQPGAAPAQSETARLIAVAESLKPKLNETVHRPLSLVRAAADANAFLRFRMQPGGSVESLDAGALRHGDSFILDFGEHITGRLAFTLTGYGEAVDSPVRLKLIFGEVPGDVAVPLETYQGTLSRAWLPDEIVNVDFLAARPPPAPLCLPLRQNRGHRHRAALRGPLLQYRSHRRHFRRTTPRAAPRNRVPAAAPHR